jgi:hypothetical protein
MAPKATRFVQALVDEGCGEEEARDVARLVTKLAARAGYPFTISAMVGRRNCQITADVEGNALVLASLTVLDVGHR